MIDRVSCSDRNARQKMPLLLYLPIIVWMGMVELMQQEMRAPEKTKLYPARQ
jgi:hypothetical protein